MYLSINRLNYSTKNVTKKQNNCLHDGFCVFDINRKSCNIELNIKAGNRDILLNKKDMDNNLYELHEQVLKETGLSDLALELLYFIYKSSQTSNE